VNLSKNKDELTLLIKSSAYELDFSFCGVSKADYLKDEAVKLKNWLDKKKHGQMTYMQNNFEKRLNPGLLVENAKSIISVLLNYYPKTKLTTENNYKIAKYAYGKDYHFVLKNKLHKLISIIENNTGKRNCRAFVDSAPVMEKTWAQKSGLGWIGKNTCLINKNIGSFFFIGQIIIDFELNYDKPGINYCGDCTKCIDACPTGAITKPFEIDANKCISYLTIEYKNKLPDELKNKFNDWVFGCDICQDVCPWNRFAKPHNEPAFYPNKGLQKMGKTDWENLDKENFKKIFSDSAVKRIKFEGLKRNIEFLLQKYKCLHGNRF